MKKYCNDALSLKHDLRDDHVLCKCCKEDHIVRFSKTKVKSEPESEDDECTSPESTDIDEFLSEDDDVELILPFSNAPHATC